MKELNIVHVKSELVKDLEKEILSIPMDDKFLRGFSFTLNYKGILNPSSRPKETYLQRKKEFKKRCLERGILPFTELPLGIKETDYKNSWGDEHNHELKLLPVKGLEESLICGTTIPNVPDMKIHRILYNGEIAYGLRDGINIFRILKDYILDKLDQGYELKNFTSKNAWDTYLENNVEFLFSRDLGSDQDICLSYDGHIGDVGKRKGPELFDWFDNLKNKYGVKE